MRFKNLTMIFKVSSLLLLVGIVAVAGSGVLAYQMRTTTAAFEQLHQRQLTARRFLQKADREIVWIERSIIQNIWAQSDADNAKYLADTEKGEADFRAAMAAAKTAYPDFAGQLAPIIERFEQVIGITCTKTIELANAATTLEGDNKAFEEMNKSCEPPLSNLSTDISSIVKTIVESSDKEVSGLSATANQIVLIVICSVVAGVTCVLGVAIAVTHKGIVLPIRTIVTTMSTMSNGDLTVAVTGSDRKDELGQIARALEIFRAGLAQTEDMRRKQAAEDRAQATLAASRADEAAAFISRMSSIADGITRASGNVSESARNLSATAEETSRQAQAVSAAAEEAATNVQTVAASTEEMSASIREIGTQVRSAEQISSAASQEAAGTEAEVRALADSVNKIDEVVALISSIASQTNLLALNATIEAARAGEMGRGFAIVAQEVKQLAAQTGKATEEIGKRISEIRDATGRTVGSIDKIVTTIDEIRTISTAISTAIEQQGAATAEIASNTQRAAAGTGDVTENISGVGRAAEMTGQASTDLMQLSSGLAAQAADLQREVTTFVGRVKA